MANVTITSPARSNGAAPSAASLSIVGDNVTTVHPWIQTSRALSPVATVTSGLPSGGGIRFDLTNIGTSSTTTLYATGGAGPFSASFTSVPLGNYTLDAYMVDSAHVIQAGATNHDQVVGIGVGWIVVAVGDSITAGYPLSEAAVLAWTDSGAVLSSDSRNFQTADNGAASGYRIGYTVALNNYLSSSLGFPVLVYNKGYSGWTGTQILSTMQQSWWRTRVSAFSPSHFTINFGGNDAYYDAASPATFRSRALAIINEIASQYSVAADHIWLSKTSTMPQDYVLPSMYLAGIDARCQSYGAPVDDLVANGYCQLGPDYYTYFSANPGLLYQAHDCHMSAAGYTAAAGLWATSLGVNASPTRRSRILFM
jgi:lysophospholipase L1-like esterase